MCDIPRPNPRLSMRGQVLAVRLLGARAGGSSPGWRTCRRSLCGDDGGYETQEDAVDDYVRDLVGNIATAVVPAGPICNVKCEVHTWFRDGWTSYMSVTLDFSGHVAA